MQTDSISIQAIPEAPAPHQFAQLLRELITQYGALEQSNAAPVLDIKKLLLELAKNVKPSVPVPPVIEYLPLEKVNKPNLTTAEASWYLSRSPQTLRIWSCRSGTGPIRPRRIGGILAWNTAEVKALCGVTA
jgi:hypothetical protein